MIPDLPLTGNVSGQAVPGQSSVWALGDGPLWGSAAMSNIYASTGVPPLPAVVRDPSTGTLNIAIRDCAGGNVEGASVALDPPPERLL